MQVLRDNKDSLMAVLEAFVYDPLISWRLLQTEVDARQEGDYYELPTLLAILTCIILVRQHCG